MIYEDALLVPGCPLCDTYIKKEIIKLYWPEHIEDIEKSEFIIVNFKNYKTPLIIYRDHVTSIPREAWGRILYRSKQIFGNGIILKTRFYEITDHFHCYVENMEKY